MEDDVASDFAQICTNGGLFLALQLDNRQETITQTYTCRKSSVEGSTDCVSKTRPLVGNSRTHFLESLLAWVDGDAVDTRVKDGEWHDCALVVECSPYVVDPRSAVSPAWDVC